MNILGISAFYHDSAACLIRDGQIIAAAQQERFSRVKHDHRFPHDAIQYCLKEGSITADDLNYVAFYDKPFIKLRDSWKPIFLLPAGLGVFSHGHALVVEAKTPHTGSNSVQHGIQRKDSVP